MSKIKELTCIVCPSGCRIKCELDDDGKVISITGNTCKRGYNYASQEMTHPMRTLTSTVEVNLNGQKHMLPVRTNKGIPRETLNDAMNQIRKILLTKPVETGDVIVKDFIEVGTDLIACKTIK